MKFMVFIQRPRYLSPAEFGRHYLEDHAAQLLTCPGVRRYVANLIDVPQDILAAVGFAPPPLVVDAVDEVWLESNAAVRALQQVYELSPNLRQAGHGHADTRGSMYHCYRVTEHVHVEWRRSWGYGEQSPGLKIIFPVCRAAGTSHEQFVDHWLRSHVPLALKHHPGMRTYITNPVSSALTPEAPEIDGVAELRFLSEREFQERMFDSPKGKAVIVADIVKFISPKASGAYIAREFILSGEADA